jgi:hypothetical protein
MELQKILALQDAWQRAVREHAAFMRDAKAAKLDTNEIHRRSRTQLARIDLIFARLKAAEESRRELAMQ